MKIKKELTKKMERMFQNDLRFTKGASHCHSQNSIDDGFAKESDICKVAVDLGADAAFLSDHGTAMGWDDFDEAAKETGIKPIFGLEAYYLDDVTHMKSHLVLYAMNENGLYKIRKAMSRGTLISNSKDEEDGFTCLTDENLEMLKGGDIIATSACIGGVFGSIVLYNDKIKRKIDKLENEIKDFSDSVAAYETLLAEYTSANERFSVLKAEVSEIKAASKKPFLGKQKQLESMKKKVDKAEEAFDKFVVDGKDTSARSVKVALAQLEITVTDPDDFQNAIEEARMKYNQRVAQLKNEKDQIQALVATLDKKIEEMEEAKERRATAKAALDEVEKDVVKVQNKREKIAEYESSRLTQQQSQELFQKRLAQMLDVFGKNFYIEVQNHGLEMEEKIYTWLVKTARKHKIPLIAANDAHVAYNSEDDVAARQIRRSLRFARWEEVTDDVTEYYIKNDRELALALYQILPEDAVIEAMSNVSKVVAACNASIEKESHAPKAKGISNVKEEIIKIARSNINHKYKDGWTQMHEDRFNYEIGIIDSMGFNDYFYITWDILNVARKIGGLSYEKLDELKATMNAMTLDELMTYLDKYNLEPNLSVGLGRGSGAGSVVCYLLGITNIDPFKYDLLFERRKDCVH